MNKEVYTPKTARQGVIKLLAIAAHHDDIEIMAADGIVKAVTNPDTSFYACVVTDGAGSARTGSYADFTDAQMMEERKKEQKKAADIGGYGGLYLLNYSSSEVKNSEAAAAKNDIKQLILDLKPQVVYTHNLCDKHDTHVGVASKVIAALRELPPAQRPAFLYGCEVWRDLDWLCDDEKVCFDLTGHDKLLGSLLNVFASQIAGGKRYDLATAGRRLANATYSSSHTVDTAQSVSYAMDLTPLIKDDSLSVSGYAISAVDRFKEDVSKRLNKIVKK